MVQAWIRRAAFGLSAVVVLVLAGCGDGQTVTPIPSTPPASVSASAAPDTGRQSPVLQPLRLGVALGNVLDGMPAAGDHADTYGPDLQKRVFCDIKQKVAPGMIVRFDVVAGDTAYKGATTIDAQGFMSAGFADYDVPVEAALACGARPLLVIIGTIYGDPGCPGGASCLEHDQLLRGYARALAKNYQGKAIGYAYGNEMNFRDNNVRGKVDVAEQVHDTNLFAEAVHSVDSAVPVGFGSVGPAATSEGMNMLAYTQAAFQQGFNGDVNFIGLNIACYPELPGPGCRNWMEAYGRNGIYDAMVAYNARTRQHLRLVTTELTGGPNLGPAAQAGTLTRGYDLLAQAKLPELGALCWYGWDDKDDRSGLASHSEILSAFRGVRARYAAAR